MAAYPTRIETQAGRRLTEDQIFQATRTREQKLSRLLMAYIVSGIVFMLLPGTFLGVWNLISISDRHAADAMSPAWIQAHGHAQIFGWIGTFIMGIGFYSIPKLRRMDPFALWTAWSCWAMWIAGVALHWVAAVYGWHWRSALPASATLELLAFAVFFRAVSGHRPGAGGTQQQRKRALEPWIIVVIIATVGMMLMVVLNFGASLYLALRGDSPAFPHIFDQHYLVLAAWGFMVPFVWGFSARWLPVFLGLKKPNTRLLISAATLNLLATGIAFAGLIKVAALLLLIAALASVLALRLLEKPERPAKTLGVHVSFPFFVRAAYIWLTIAAVLSIWAASLGQAAGVWGASRHALTVGFIATMVFAIGQRVLPAFAGMRLLFSPKLMFAALLLLTIGCSLRVSAEILAYQGYWISAWGYLPVSAVIELSAVTVFALNIVLTFARRPVVSATALQTINQ